MALLNPTNLTNFDVDKNDDGVVDLIANGMRQSSQ